MNNVRIFRLKDGEDIITSYHLNSSGLIEMHDPMTLFYKRMSAGKSMLLMSPWLPIELIQKNTACISMNEVLTIVEPRTALIEYYNNAVVEANEVVSNFTDHIDESLLEEFDSDEEFDLEDEPVEVVQDRSTNKKTIH
jgi:hypothetical protein